jgi:hypothetical protein
MKIFVLSKLKFILNRNNLNKIYLTYILPLLEYAYKLWDGCYSRDADKLEQLQLEAARIITGCQNFQARNPYTQYMYLLTQQLYIINRSKVTK